MRSAGAHALMETGVDVVLLEFWVIESGRCVFDGTVGAPRFGFA